MPETKILGVVLKPLREIPTPDGAVLHMLRADDPDFTQFGECYFSEVYPGKVKAWKMHEYQEQNLSVPVGKIRLVLYDARPASPTYKQMEIIELGRPESYCKIRIPSGIWYGFKGISAQTALIVNCADKPHDPTDNKKIPAEDAEINYTW